MLDSVQALRALAALCVVVYHVDFVARGAFGVDIFFVISGFIICHVTAADHDGFLRKRLIRIVPLYWTGTLCLFVLAFFAPQLLKSAATLSGLVDSLLFIPYAKDGGRVYPILFLGWTLNYEMFFYALFACALALNRRLAPIMVCAVLVLLAAAGQIVGPGSVIGRFYTSPILLEFCYGIAVFHAWQRARAALLGASRLLVLAAACTVVLGMAALTAEDSAYRFAVWGLPSAVVVLLMLGLQGRIAFPLGIVALGDASYSLYLFHPYVLKVVDRTAISFAEASFASVCAALLYIGLSLLLAIAVYRHFERPVSRLLRARLLGRAAAPLRPAAARAP